MTTSHKKILRTPSALSLAIISLLASPLSLAADEGWFVGASIGETSASLRFNSAILPALPAGVTLTDLYYDDSDTGFKAFGGYQFNPYFALEVGHFDLGEYEFNATTSPAGTSTGNFDVDGRYVDAVGTLPLTAKLDLIGRVGFNYAFTKTNLEGTGALPASSRTRWSRDWNPKLGAGLQYALTDNLDLRLEAERYHLDEPVRHKGDVELYSLGVVYRFGSGSAEPREVARAPAPRPALSPATTPTRTPTTPVARATPPVAEPPAAPTPPPVPTRVVFSADSLFDFDQSIVKEAGRQDLDRFIADLNGANFDNITVTGHSDRIGNREYNLGLSQRRADAVKAYLVNTGKLPAARIMSRGVNGDSSRIGENQCRNTSGRDALILCLQADRRVEVEVNATRP